MHASGTCCVPLALRDSRNMAKFAYSVKNALIPQTICSSFTLGCNIYPVNTDLRSSPFPIPPVRPSACVRMRLLGCHKLPGLGPKSMRILAGGDCLCHLRDLVPANGFHHYPLHEVIIHSHPIAHLASCYSVRSLGMSNHPLYSQFCTAKCLPSNGIQVFATMANFGTILEIYLSISEENQ